LFSKKRNFDFVYSPDSDALAFGGPKLLRNLLPSQVDEVNLNNVLECLNLDLSKFINLCILLGCDYMKERINFGGKFSELLGLVQKSESTKMLLDSVASIYSVSENFSESFMAARSIFRSEDFGTLKTVGA